MGIMKLLGTSFSTILNGGNPTADRTVTFPDASGEALLQGRALTLMTAQNSTSGTSIDFTGIPSWAKRITVMFNGVSVSGTSAILVQLGTPSGIDVAGYTGASSYTTTVVSSVSYTTGFGFNTNALAATYLFSGDMTIKQISGNSFVESGVLISTVGAAVMPSAGSKTLSGTLDRIRITTVNGTDTFDAGSINVMYEG